MKKILFTCLLVISWNTRAQVTVKGVVTEQNSGNRPIAGVQIKALGAAPEATGNDGLFQLLFSAKKPGDRIIVSEISKPGFEIVNKDVVNNWVIQNDPEARTKVVMCPEGLIAENTLKYYNISLAGLTKAYESRVASLKQQVEQSQIDQKTYMEQARELADQYEKQQGQMEELAEKFARENFDDCNSIHQQAFEAFKLGDITEAIRLLESVNSKEEIAKALQQQAKAESMISEIQDMLAQSKDIIQQNIKKLMFQGDLYMTELRFKEAEEAYETAVLADTSNFLNVIKLVNYLTRQGKYVKSISWSDMALSIAATDEERSTALHLISIRHIAMRQFYEAEAALMEKIELDRRIIDKVSTIDNKLPLIESLSRLGETQIFMGRFLEAKPPINEAINMLSELSSQNEPQIDYELAVCNYRMGQIHRGLREYEDALSYFQKSLDLYRLVKDFFPLIINKPYSETLAEMSMTYRDMNNYVQAELVAKEAVAAMREGAHSKREHTTMQHALVVALHNLASLQSALGRYDESEQSFFEALLVLKESEELESEVLKYTHAVVVYDLGRLEMGTGKYAQAAAHFEEALKIKKEIVKQNLELNLDILNVFHLTGRAYLRLGQYEKATSYFNESIDFTKELSVKNPERYNAIHGTRLSHVSQEYEGIDLMKAISYNEEALRIHEQAPNASIDSAGMEFVCARMSRYLLMAKRLEEAEKYAYILINYTPKNRRSYRYLAHCFLYQGKYDEAEKLYMELGPMPSPMFGKTLGDIFLEDFVAFEKAGLQHPDVEKIRMKLGAN